MHAKLSILLLCFFFFVKAQAQNIAKPNIIFILSDDVGYSVPTVNGGNSFYTPNIDSMARNGINFSHCESTPLCCPSRIMLLTGKHNFRNYSNWGYLSHTEKTFGNVTHDAGYKTGFFGKLQLEFQDSIMKNWGFDEYTVFELTAGIRTRRYKSPTLTDNTGQLPDSLTKNKYCDDILTDRICNFIDSNKSKNFMVYYSMSIGHAPYSPTPDDPEYNSWDFENEQSDPRFYKPMINYMDKKIGVILHKLQTTGLDKNTIVIFAGDNGVPQEIYYDADGIKNIQGEKGYSTEGGTHVPLMVYWPGHIKAGTVNDDLIDFADFLPTFADAAHINKLVGYDTLDGISFYKRLLAQPDTAKQQLFLHYVAHPGFEAVKRWVRNKKYKLYDTTFKAGSSGRFYNIITDVEEKKPLVTDSLSAEELTLMQNFRIILDTIGNWNQAPVIEKPFFSKITYSSVEIGATIKSFGASNPLDRGSTISLAKNEVAYLNDKRQHDSIVELGTYTMLRNTLASQTKYNFSMYAMNNNAANSTSFALDSFYTLSYPPLKQPTSLKLINDTCFSSLQWISGKFPSRGATRGGYAIYYSSDTVKLIDSPNAKAPSSIIKTGKLAALTTSILPQLPDSSVILSSISKDTLYNFLLIPYTWDGNSDSTYDYLTKDALTITTKPSSSHISLNISNVNPSCFGDSSGSITVTAFQGTMPYTYSLNNYSYSTSSSFNSLKSGTYSIAAKDKDGCVVTQNVVLAQPSKLYFSTSSNNLLCFNDNNGRINIKSGGGTPPYAYSLNNSIYKQDSIFSNLSAGIYFVMVKDTNSCTDTASVILKQPAQLIITTSIKNLSCNSAADATITILAQKGVAPYAYSINGSEFKNTPVFDSLSAGKYKITVKDKNGCSASKNISIATSGIECMPGLTVTPNPSTSQFFINVGNDLINEEISIKVFDAHGKTIFIKTGMHQAQYSFGNNFPSGTYFVSVQANNSKYHFKLIKL